MCSSDLVGHLLKMNVIVFKGIFAPVVEMRMGLDGVVAGLGDKIVHGDGEWVMGNGSWTWKKVRLFPNCKCAWKSVRAFRRHACGESTVGLARNDLSTLIGRAALPILSHPGNR